MKGVFHVPDSISMKFLKLMKDYLEESKREMNYQEASRAQSSLKELMDHEMKRQCTYMERKQKDELIMSENLQRE